LFMNSTNFQQKILDYLISIISSRSFPHCEYCLRCQVNLKMLSGDDFLPWFLIGRHSAHICTACFMWLALTTVIYIYNVSLKNLIIPIGYII
jgi:hypothetical protein